MHRFFSLRHGDNFGLATILRTSLQGRGRNKCISLSAKYMINGFSGPKILVEGLLSSYLFLSKFRFVAFPGFWRVLSLVHSRRARRCMDWRLHHRLTRGNTGSRMTGRIQTVFQTVLGLSPKVCHKSRKYLDACYSQWRSKYLDATHSEGHKGGEAVVLSSALDCHHPGMELYLWSLAIASTSSSPSPPSSSPSTAALPGEGDCL